MTDENSTPTAPENDAVIGTATSDQANNIKITPQFIVLIIVLIGMIASIILSALAFANTRRSYELLEAQLSSATETTRENDVTIMDEYVIRSTEHISDAYLSGNTSSLSDKDLEVLNLASGILDEIITDGMSDYEKELAVYEWMCHNLNRDTGLLTVIPTSGEDSDNPYGVLKYHDAVCVGYATTFRLFMQMMEIPCMVVHNTEMYHSWDLVQLDGNWYHTDIYGDVGDGNYSNFNLNDSMRSAQGHSWDTDFYPSADSLEYNMAFQNSAEVESIYDIPQMIVDSLDAYHTTVSIRLDNITDEQAYVVRTAIDSISESIYYDDTYGNVYMNYSFNPIENGYLLVVDITNYNYDDPSAVEPADVDVPSDPAMDEAVSNALSQLGVGGKPELDGFYDDGVMLYQD